MSKTIVSIERVNNVQPHPNADRLDVVQVLGYNVVSGRGEFNIGDQVVYFPPDILIPENIADRLGVKKYLKYAIFPKQIEKTQCRVSAARLRGVPSHGFITKMNPELISSDFGTDVSSHYGAYKYEPPVRLVGADVASDIAGFHKYTDIENIQRFPNAFTENDEIVITEKIHGCLSADQLITMFDGSRKKIFKIKIGDNILGVDHHGQLCNSIVTAISKRRYAKTWLDIKTTKHGIERGNFLNSIMCTPEHKFYSVEDRNFIEIKNLKIGTEVLMHQRYSKHTGWSLPLVPQVIKSITNVTRKFTGFRYDLETTSHNYFANNVLVHNSNCRLGLIREKDTFTFCVGSHNVRLKEGPNRYWYFMTETVKQLLCDLAPGSNVIIFGEIFGPGIQDLDYGQQKPGFRVFDISIDGKYVNYWDLLTYAVKYKFATVPHLYDGKFSNQIVEQYTYGDTTFSNVKSKFKGREGCVIRPQIERHSNSLNGRLILKSISADYRDRMGAIDDA